MRSFQLVRISSLGLWEVLILSFVVSDIIISIRRRTRRYKGRRVRMFGDLEGIILLFNVVDYRVRVFMRILVPTGRSAN